MVGVEILEKSEPYYKPGYTGHCPQDKFICGKTYGDLSHDLLLDPTVDHSENLALVDNTEGYDVRRPKKEDIDLVNERKNNTDAIYGHPVLTTYAGHIPQLGDVRDKPYEIQAIQGIAEFERKRLKRQKSLERLQRTIELQSGTRHPSGVQDRLLLQSKFKLPLIAVHPERIGILKSHPINERYERPKDYSTSPYFMDNMNPQKYFINGYTGYRPYRSVHIGKTHKTMTNDGLSDFSSKYQDQKRSEWAPIYLSTENNNTSRDQGTTGMIYKKNTAIMPSYTGHVPGAKFRLGKTYGYSSKQANHYIEEKLFKYKLKECEFND